MNVPLYQMPFVQLSWNSNFPFFWALLGLFGRGIKVRWLVFEKAEGESDFFLKTYKAHTMSDLISARIPHRIKLQTFVKLLCYDGAESVWCMFWHPTGEKHISAPLFPRCHPVLLPFSHHPPAHILSTLIFSLLPSNNDQSFTSLPFLSHPHPPPMSDSPTQLIVLRGCYGDLS